MNPKPMITSLTCQTNRLVLALHHRLSTLIFSPESIKAHVNPTLIELSVVRFSHKSSRHTIDFIMQTANHFTSAATCKQQQQQVPRPPSICMSGWVKHPPGVRSLRVHETTLPTVVSSSREVEERRPDWRCFTRVIWHPPVTT